MKECSHGVPINEWCDECIKETREHNDRLDDIYAGRLQDLESRLEEVADAIRKRNRRAAAEIRRNREQPSMEELCDAIIELTQGY